MDKKNKPPEEYRVKFQCDASGKQIEGSNGVFVDCQVAQTFVPFVQHKSDIETIQNMLEEAEAMSNVDALTQIPNRRAYDNMIIRETEKLIRGGDVCLMLIDVDHFKKYNDNYGHTKGDEILKEVAQTLKNTLRGYDFCARYGGEEFVVVLTGESVKSANEVAEKLRSAVEKQHIKNIHRDDDQSKVTVSIGVHIPTNEEKQELLSSSNKKYLTQKQVQEFIKQLQEEADNALYRAKDNGRNQVATFNEAKKIR